MPVRHLTSGLLILFIAAACSAPGNPKVPAGAKSSGGLHAVIETDKGRSRSSSFRPTHPRRSRTFACSPSTATTTDSTFHRIVRGFMIQGGDPSGDGSGGQSAWGPPFEDEINPESALYRGGYRRSLIAMANRGPTPTAASFSSCTATIPCRPAT